MNSGAISKRYAKALLAYAKEEQEEDTVYIQLKRMLKHYFNVKDLRIIVLNPTYPKQKKLDLLITAAYGDMTCNSLKRFLELVLNHKREKLLLFMLFSYMELYREERNIYRCKLTTAVPVPETITDHLKKLFTDKYSGEVEFNTKIDPNIIGGYILEMASHRVDASVAGKLKRVKKQFIEKNRRIV